MKNIKFDESIKRHNFEVLVEFEESIDDVENISKIILLMIEDIYTDFENGKKTINLTIKSYNKTLVEELYIPKINLIKVCRYNFKGELLLTEIYKNCKFICNLVRYSYKEQDNADSLDVTYKFLYNDYELEVNKI